MNLKLLALAGIMTATMGLTACDSNKENAAEDLSDAQEEVTDASEQLDEAAAEGEAVPADAEAAVADAEAEAGEAASLGAASLHRPGQRAPDAQTTRSCSPKQSAKKRGPRYPGGRAWREVVRRA